MTDRNQLIEIALRNLWKVADELCTAVDNAAQDIGGSRSIAEILAELGPATDEAEEALSLTAARRQSRKQESGSV